MGVTPIRVEGKILFCVILTVHIADVVRKPRRKFCTINKGLTNDRR